MRKRTSSEIVNFNSLLVQEINDPESVRKVDELKLLKKKGSANQLKFRTVSHDPPSLETKKDSNNISEGIGMVGSLRRTTSVPNSAGEDNISSRRRTVTGSGENEAAKHKTEPLPDILHDWEIIVKSLRENQNESENVNIVEPVSPVLKVSKIPNSTKSIRSLKVDHTDSDKENSLLKRKNTNEFLSPSTSGSKTNQSSDNRIVKINKSSPEIVPKPNKYQTETLASPKTIKSQTETSPHDDSEAIWRRPTRSTFKAFENVFESPELIVPLESEFNGSDQNEILAIKEILTTPEKVNESEDQKISVIKKHKIKRLSKSPLRKLRSNKILSQSFIKNSSSSKGHKRRGRPKKLLSKSLKLFKAKVRECKILKVRQLRKGLLRIGRSVTSKSVISPENRHTKLAGTSACRELYVKIVNLKIPDQEMDFVGFGSPSSSEKVQLKSSLRKRPIPPIEIIKEEHIETDVNDTPSSLKETRLRRKIGIDNRNILGMDNSHPHRTPKEKLTRSKKKLSKLENGLSPHKKTQEVELSEFEKYFGCDEKCLLPDFVGFPSKVSNQKTCLKCSLILHSSEALKHHKKVGHKRIYACPFDLGQCGLVKGSINLHNHLIRDHASLISFLQFHLNSDLQCGKIANWMSELEGCAVCFMPLEQPNRCIHEMLVHGIWPPSLLNLSSVSIDQHVSLWWANHTLAFACHLCHTTQPSTSRNSTIPIVRSAPHCFPTLLSNHLRNVHLLNLPLFQGWFLTIRLLLSIPAMSRRTLVSTIILGVDSKVSYSNCVICKIPLSFYSNINLHFSHGLCSKCEVICRLEEQCWFNCSNEVQMEQNIINHMVSEHNNRIPGAWCIICGNWASNIMAHSLECSNETDTNCKFCSLKISGLSTLKKVWHSLFCHVFPCPIPNCTNAPNNEIQYCLSSAGALFKHLIFHHFPDWESFNLDQISSFIVKSKKTHGVVLTKFSAQHLDGLWIGLSGHRYSLSGGILSPIDIIKVPMVCILCAQRWEKIIDYSTRDGSSVCTECTLLLSQSENGELSSQCPVYRCLEKKTSLSTLCQHLVHEHKLSPCNDSKCSYCGTVAFNSPLATITHSILKHSIACYICPFTAPTLLLLQTHHTTMHGLPSWDAVYQHLKMEEFSRGKNREKSEILDGVIRIWQGDQGTLAQWDSSLRLSELVIDDEEINYGGVINQQIQDGHLQVNLPTQDLNEVDSWCSSLCTVSMSSPSKPTKELTSPEKDIKPDISQIINKKHLSNHESPNLLEKEKDEDSSSIGFIDSKKNNQDPKTPSNSLQVLFDEHSDDSDSSDGNISNGSIYDRPLKIDSSVQSPESHSTDDKSSCNDYKNSMSVITPECNQSNSIFSEQYLENNICNRQIKSLKDINKETIAVSNAKNDTKTPTFGLVETLSSVMEETLQSMSSALSGTLGNKENESLKTSFPPGIKKSKVDGTKGLGENAFIDEKVMAENILKDLEEKYSGTCVDCGSSILLPHLKVHMMTIHPDKLICCSCGYKGELYAFLVHSFHMSHLPNEARPIILRSEGSEKYLMIVLEARPDLKTMTYPCYKCSKRFKQEKSRQLHYNLCKLEKKFSCDVCGEKFALDNHLQKHKEWKHNPQVCKHCGKTFNSSSSLAQHVLHIHKKPLSQRCRQCGDAFNTSKQLKVHSRIHSGEQPHSCKHCPQRFISRNLLLKHTIKMHKDLLSDKERAQHYKLNGSASSSSDSSDSDDSIPGTRIKFKRQVQNDDNVKVMALTESDLNTSSSDIEEVQPLLLPIKKAKGVNSKKPSTLMLAKSEKGQGSKSKPAGIYQDREAVALPEMRANIKAKVESSIGRVCVPCGQEFDSPTAKLLHMYLIHPGLVLTLGFSECSFCDHKFPSADDVSNHHLDKHQRTPLSNGNFRCLCGLVFREDGAYYFHLYYAHKAQRALNIGGEIVCRLCEGRPRLNKIVDLVVHLSDRHTMFDHVRFNDSYMCNFCYKAFESWTVLSLHFFMVHKATKSQTLSYDCPYCHGASPWHSLEALQYHLDNVHRGRHTQSRHVPEHSRNIYTPAPAPSSPTKRKELKPPPVKPIQVKNLSFKKLLEKNSPVKSSKKPLKMRPKKLPDRSTVLYCICQCPYDEVSDMIGCDNTNCKFQWFHFECVGIMAAPEGNWYCPDCTNIAQQKQKLAQKQSQLQADLYEYYDNYSNDATTVNAGEVTTAAETRKRQHSTSSNSSNSSNSSSSSSSNSSSSSSSSSGESSSASGDEN